ncbi:hypothetical protein ACIRBX_19055 [Kitasatospora sp. NPDC096147]|uniref:hypothetical protein n=1 Tax=Kitasatospora sp. NPDC096147 TaxID=3364093 RepID=UPI00380A81FB
MPGAPLPDDFDEPAADRPHGASPIRCPACRREHLYEPPSLPCPCGAQLRVPLLRGGIPVQIRFRSWEDSWLSMRCPHCGRNDQWPQPEFTCNCGATVRLPVDRAPRLQSTGPQHAGPRQQRPAAPRAFDRHGLTEGTGPHSDRSQSDGLPAEGRPTVPAQGGAAAWEYRAPFRPHPVRSEDDAVLTAARYLRWLGFDDLELTEDQDASVVTLLGGRMVAQVDGTGAPADLRTVECLWLRTLHAEEIAAALFSRSGFSQQALVRGEQLLVALFRLDQSGIPQPANGAAEALLETGWTS